MTETETVATSRWVNGRNRLLIFLVILFGSRTAYLCLTYFYGISGTQRFQVETSALWLVVAAVLLTAVRQRNATDRSGLPAHHRGECVLWILGAVALYWPALTLGFLSDDYSLTDRASTFALELFNPEAFRPVPLFVWGVILRLGGGAITLHALNVALHGTNAFLTTRIVEPVARCRGAAVAAGLLVLTMPVLVEPVVWCSGVFDVMATTFVLLAVLAGRDYKNGSSGARVRLYSFSVAGLLSKETAVVVPVLIALDAWVRRERANRLYWDIATLTGGMAVVGVVRLAFASATVRRPLSKYLVQRWVFGTIGGLAVPWHADLIRAHAWIPTVVAWMLIALLLLFCLRRVDPTLRRAFYGMGAWPFVATAPAVTFFFISPDLQSSRYLYLATTGWSALLVKMTQREDRRSLEYAALMLLVASIIAFDVYGVRQHIEPWREAAAARDAFETAASRDPRLRECSMLAVRNAPDSVRGAYVLRNGAVEALRRDVGLPGRIGTPGPGCSFVWNAAAGKFDRELPR